MYCNYFASVMIEILKKKSSFTANPGRFKIAAPHSRPESWRDCTMFVKHDETTTQNSQSARFTLIVILFTCNGHYGRPEPPASGMCAAHRTVKCPRSPPQGPNRPLPLFSEHRRSAAAGGSLDFIAFLIELTKISTGGCIFSFRESS